MADTTEDAVARFKFDGSDYAFKFRAESWDDAEAKLRAIRTTATLDGWPCYTYKANAFTLPLVGIWCAITCFVRNLIGARR